MDQDDIIVEIPRDEDLELHVKVSVIEDETLINVREYVPSRNLYGRGLLFTPAELPAVIKGLQAAKKAIS